MIQKETLSTLIEASYIKDGMARLVVEMAKREWPQQWPTFLTELTDLPKAQCGLREFQTELVLLVLLRLTEDVAVFQSVDSSRRKDLYQALQSNMGDIFEFLSHLLEVEVKTYQLIMSSNNLEEKKLAAIHCRLAQSVLNCFQAHADWVSINHIMANEGQLLVQLCLLLSEENLRLAAAECLLQV